MAAGDTIHILPAHLDLFTACVGGAGIGGLFGGCVAWLTDKDIVKGGIVGGIAGLVVGAILAILQAYGVHF